ncbi:MAG TPA: CRISPR-associated endonuclease Cas1 [Candidatus Ruthenibacterium merdigallinarum]|nr:CRISPR-associated endonuclease Cas1 [Candidatus Ruthenibacterium merdigallinarum]
MCFAYAGASPALMGACAQRGVDLVFFTPNGRFLARAGRNCKTAAHNHGNQRRAPQGARG